MITIACLKCRHAMRVVGEDDETQTLVGRKSDLWPNKFKCFQCGAMAEGMLTVEISAAAWTRLIVHEVTPQEAFAAVNGMGIPEEHTCCAEVIEPMFEAVGVKVRGHQLPRTNRYVIEQLVFPDGRTVHLGAAMQGALAFRVTKKHSYVRAVEETRHVD